MIFIRKFRLFLISTLIPSVLIETLGLANFGPKLASPKENIKYKEMRYDVMAQKEPDKQIKFL